MAVPQFKDGKCTIVDYKQRKLVLKAGTWRSHIIKDNNRLYFKTQFETIVDAVKSPLRVFESKKEKDVIIYSKHFEHFFVANQISMPMYVYVVV